MPKTDLSVVATNACGWPNLSKLENGDLICVYFNAPSHGLLEGDLVVRFKSRSRENGRKLGLYPNARPTVIECIWPWVQLKIVIYSVLVVVSY